MTTITPIVSGQEPVSTWSPLRLSVFRWLWIATLASNTGTWMHDVGAGWLMTSLSPSAVMVALVQTATSLPVFLLALPAGALSDIVDRRRYLIVVQVWMAMMAALLAIISFFDAISAWMLVALTFAMGIGTAMTMPAWAAITPELVPRIQLQSAIALNSLGVNVARAIGPALAGVIVSLWGTGAVFALNALSYLGVIWVLVRWRRQAPPSALPSERFLGALRGGLRFARHAPELQAAVIRGLGFFLFASASWALLPLVARSLVNGGPQAGLWRSGGVGRSRCSCWCLVASETARGRFARCPRGRCHRTLCVFDAGIVFPPWVMAGSARHAHGRRCLDYDPVLAASGGANGIA